MNPTSGKKLAFGPWLRRRLWPNRKATGAGSVTIRLAVAVIALGTGSLILTMGIVDGFQEVIPQKVKGFWGDAQLMHTEIGNAIEPKPFTYGDSLSKVVRASKAVTDAQPYTLKAGIISNDSGFVGVLLKGVAIDYKSLLLEKSLRAGRMPRYSPDSLGLETLIPQSVATQLGVGVGDGIVCYFIQQPPRARKFTITGIYQTGVESEFGKPYLITDVRQLQKLNNWDSLTFSGVQVGVTTDSDPVLAAKAISENLPPELTVHAIETLYPQLFAWLGLFDTNEMVILCIMLAVAGINMLGVMLVLILEKSQVIGVLKALGTSSNQLSRIFLGRASFEAFKGIAIGLVIGLGISLAQIQFGLIQLDEASYYVKAVPIHLDYMKIAALAIGEFAVCMAIAWVPLLTLRRLSPVKAMKYV